MRASSLAVPLVLSALAVNSGGEASPTPASDPSPSTSPAAETAPDAAGFDVPQPGLALGLTEPNPWLIWSEQARPEAPEPFGQWRERLRSMRPAVYRLVVQWRQVQPTPGALALDAPQSGCLRDRQPCAGWAGVREQLAALASRQREDDWRGMIVIWDTPDWAAAPALDCEKPGTEPRSRPPSRSALDDYRRLVRALAGLAAEVGAEVTYWSAWNEPNHPYFLANQCSDSDSARAGASYLDLVRALDAALAPFPRTERVLGELAGIDRSGPNKTGVREFVAEMPRDVVCGSRIWAQHQYAGGADAVGLVLSVLSEFDCPREHRVWVTETGAGSPSFSLSAGAPLHAGRRACVALDRALSRWWRDPRVDVAIQYTFRQDDLFRVGLVSTDLSRALPALGAWTAWSERPGPGTPPPEAPCPRG